MTELSVWICSSLTDAFGIFVADSPSQIAVIIFARHHGVYLTRGIVSVLFRSDGTSEKIRDIGKSFPCAAECLVFAEGGVDLNASVDANVACLCVIASFTICQVLM